MIPLEEFKEYIEELESFKERFDKATEILIGENIGFIDVHFGICSKYVELLAKVMNDEAEWIEWFLYEGKDINADKCIISKDIKYNIKTIEDLYYLLTDDYEKITKWNDERKEE